MPYVIAAIVILVILFLWWRYTSVGRGARKRDEKILTLLDPLGEKLAGGQHVLDGEVQPLASKPHVRPMLYAMLKHFERLDLFPKNYVDTRSQAEAVLACWLMHPNELQDVPTEMELVETVTRQIDGQRCEFFVFRYRMPTGHWAGDAWLLGLAGPFVANDVPYSGLAGAFSRCRDKYGEVEPSELVDWYIGLVRRKSR